VKQLLDDQIREQNLTTKDGYPFYESIENEIRGVNGTLFLFAGLRTNPEKVKSTEGLDVAWVEEANTVSQRSLDLLRPTLRSDDSELIFTWNPEFATDPVDAMFRGNHLESPQRASWLPPPRSIIKEVSWRDNPYFPEVLREEMDYDQRRDPDKYAHIWAGGYKKNSQARVFQNWRVEDFGEPPEGTNLRFGADWGFAADPAVLVRSWTLGRTLYVDYEAWGIGVEIDQLPALFAGDDKRVPPRWSNPRRYPGIPGAERWQIRADSSRPDTISYVRNRGFDVVPATKGPGSVDEGVEFLKTYDIVVHPRCQHVRDELSLYSYQVDKQTEAVLPLLEDKNNHFIDSLRYSHEGARRGQSATVVIRR
jgi:phage terminase large subunit